MDVGIKPDWKQFLMDNGAVFEGEHLQHFGHPEQEQHIPAQGAILCDLSHLGLISATGVDAQAFLQGQLSNDLNKVSPTRAQISSYSSPKGRAYTTFQMMQRGDSYYLSLSNDILAIVLKRLRMFVMRSKVVLENASDNLVHFGYAAPDGDQHLQAILGSIPEQPLDVVQIGALTVIRRPAAIPRFEIFAEPDDARSLWTQLSAHAARVSASRWDYFEIAAGIPLITADSIEAWVPQMLNLHLIDGISFQKGCFPGQEIVARLKYLGKNKRQLYRIGINTSDQPAINTLILDGASEEAGKILNTCLNPDGTVEALAVMKIASLSGALTLNGHTASVLELPYPMEEDAA